MFKGSLKTIEDLILLEKIYFPDGGGSLLGYLSWNKGAIFKLDVSDIKLWNHSKEDEQKKAEGKLLPVFATDTGLLLIIDFTNFDQLLTELDYDELIDSLERLNTYFNKIISKLKNKGFGLISTPGIGKGYNFEGSGSFIINK